MGTWTHFDLEDAVALQGTLDTFALPDVLRLLAATKKSGRLEIIGSRGKGSIWVAAGDVTAIVVDHAPRAVEPIEAAFELLRFEDGSFTFDAEAAPDGDQRTDVEPLLEGAEALLAEWREIEAVVPSLTSWVTMRPELPDDTVSVDRDRWTTLVAVGSGATVATIGDALRLGELPVSRAVRDLAEIGLVHIEERAPEPVVEPAAPLDPLDRVDDATHTADVPPESPDDLQADSHREAPAEPGDSAAATDEAVDQTEASGSIPGPKARRARPKQLRVSDPGQPEVFVPLDLSGLQQQKAYDSDEDSDSEAELAAAFPGLADRAATERVEDEASAADAGVPRDEAQTDDLQSDDAQTAEHDPDSEEPLNRGLLLKFLSSVKS